MSEMGTPPPITPSRREVGIPRRDWGEILRVEQQYYLDSLEILREIRDAVQDTNHYVRMAWDRDHGIKDVDPEADGDPTDSEPEYDDDFCVCDHTRANHSRAKGCYIADCPCGLFRLDTGERTIKSGDKIDRDSSENFSPSSSDRDIAHLLTTIHELRERNAQLHELLFRVSSWLSRMTWASGSKRWVDKFQADYEGLFGEGDR